MELKHLLDICMLFDDLGWRVTSQLMDTVFDNTMKEQYPKDLKRIRDEFLSQVLQITIDNDYDYLRSQVEDLIDDLTTYLQSDEIIEII